MGPSDEWAARGSMYDFERRGLPSLSKSNIGPSVAHSSLKPITDSISSMVPWYCLKMIIMTSHSYEWISFVTPIMDEKHVSYILTRWYDDWLHSVERKTFQIIVCVYNRYQANNVSLYYF